MWIPYGDITIRLTYERLEILTILTIKKNSRMWDDEERKNFLKISKIFQCNLTSESRIPITNKRHDSGENIGYRNLVLLFKAPNMIFTFMSWVSIIL